jgi:hypothetical protein
MSTFPQYAKTNMTDVIEAIERNKQGRRDFHDRAVAFSMAQGAQDGAFYPSSFAGGHAISAIGGDTKPTTGRWKEGYRGGWLPFKNNPLMAELESIKFSEEPVPGLPTLAYGPYTERGSQHVSTPQPFIHEGAVYVGFNWQPVEVERRRSGANPEDGGWEEIKASEYHAAREAYNAALEAAARVGGAA